MSLISNTLRFMKFIETTKIVSLNKVTYDAIRYA